MKNEKFKMSSSEFVKMQTACDLEIEIVQTTYDVPEKLEWKIIVDIQI